jgi:hypothetical protein
MEPKINNAPNQSKVEIPEAKDALDAMKYKIANEMGINVPKKGKAFDWRMVPSYYCGAVGGEIVKRAIQHMERMVAEDGNKIDDVLKSVEVNEGKVPHDTEPPTPYEGPTRPIQEQRYTN